MNLYKWTLIISSVRVGSHSSIGWDVVWLLILGLNLCKSICTLFQLCAVWLFFTFSIMQCLFVCATRHLMFMSTLQYIKRNSFRQKKGDLGMFVIQWDPLISYSIYWIRSVGRGKQLGWKTSEDFLVFKVFHHVFHVLQQKTDLFYAVCPYSFTIWAFDTNYQIDFPSGLFLTMKTYWLGLWYDGKVFHSDRDKRDWDPDVFCFLKVIWLLLLF